MLTVALIYHEHVGKELIPTLPRSFSKKMEFLKICFNKLPTLDPYKLAIRDLRSKAKQFVIVRDFLVHGYLVGYDPDKVTYQYTKLDNDEGDARHVEDVMYFTLINLGKNAAGVSELHRVILAINEALLTG